MQREIKYKAFHKPTGRIFNVHGWHSDYVFEDTLDGIFTSETNPAKREDCVLMEFTGLKDSKGVEIFEGDILQDNNYPEDGISNEEVVWNNIKCRFETIHTHAEDFDTMEVIGNIYSTPSLIQSKES